MTWDSPETIEDMIKPYENSLHSWKKGTDYTFSIYKVNTDKFIGRICIRQRPQDSLGVWNIGYFTVPEEQGNGYMSEAVPMIIKLGFQTLGAKRIEACHAIWNTASRIILEKSGMQFVRYIPEGFKKKGKWVSENLLAIDYETWLKMNNI